jgi:hypothetical protein
MSVRSSWACTAPHAEMDCTYHRYLDNRPFAILWLLSLP